MLKPGESQSTLTVPNPAAFGRLCVETGGGGGGGGQDSQPPSGGCVLKLYIIPIAFLVLGPAAFGRLCVETEQ